MQNRKRLTELENKLTVTGVRVRGEEIIREFGMDRYTLLYLKGMTNKDLLYTAGHSAQCYAAAWMGGENGYMYVYI